MRRGIELVIAFFAVSSTFNAKWRRQDRARRTGNTEILLQRLVKTPKKTLFEVLTPVCIDFQQDATLSTENRRSESFCLKILDWYLGRSLKLGSPCGPACSCVDCQFDVLFDVFLLSLAIFASPRASLLQF